VIPLLLALRMIVNPLANLYFKRIAATGTPAARMMAWTYLLPVAVSWPLLLASPRTSEFWGWAALTAVLDLAGNLLVIHSLAQTDLSLFGPMNAFKPALTLLFAFVLFAERPTVMALAGIALIVAGSIVLEGTHWVLTNRGVQLRLLSIVFLSFTAASLKRVVELSDPWTAFAVWAFLCAIASAPFLGKGNAVELTRLSLCFGAAQVCTVLVLGRLLAGPAMAVFQLSTLVNVYLGAKFLGEPHWQRRTLATVVMLAGAVLVISSR